MPVSFFVKGLSIYG
jgi:hypothetical protein